MKQQHVTKQAVLGVKVPLNCHFLFAIHYSLLKLSVSQCKICFMLDLRAHFILHQCPMKFTCWRLKLVFWQWQCHTCCTIRGCFLPKIMLLYPQRFLRHWSFLTNSLRLLQSWLNIAVFFSVYTTSRHFACILDTLLMGVILTDIILIVVVTYRLSYAHHFWLYLVPDHISSHQVVSRIPSFVDQRMLTGFK